MSIASLPADPGQAIAVLAFDYGTQRIGVAYGQSVSGTAQAVAVLKARDGIPDWNEIQALIDEWKPSAFVVGLPYNLDGTDSDLLPRAIKFANRLNGRFNKPCYGMDERLSSKAAIEQIAEENEAGLKRKSSAVDDIAAQIILENWFNELKAQSRD
jgi:putative Holliday junction resolvase